MKSVLRFTILIIFLLSACGTAPTSTPRPTMVPPTKTLIPLFTATQRPTSLRACVTNSTIRIRQGPGIEYEVIGGMVSGTCMSILGRNNDASWVYMVSEDNKAGWVASWLLTIDGNLHRIVVRNLSENLSLAPTSKVMPTATHKPALLFTSTPKPIIIQATSPKQNCSPAYPGVCIPSRPPDLDCGDIPYGGFTVLPPDPHGFDGDGDGIGCE